VVNAYNALQGQELEKASNYIEECMDNEKALSKDKTWRYRGQIYMAIGQNEELKANYPDAIRTAAESFMKAKELDKRGSYEGENDRGLQVVQIMALNEGVTDYNNQLYSAAIDKFAVSQEIAQHYGKIDTLAIYNTGLSHEKAGNIDKAIENYNRCAELGYNVPDVYLFVANLYKKNNQTEKALEVLSNARESYPREQAIIIEQLNIFLENEQYDKAKENLRLAAEQDPTNEILYFSLGTVSDNLGQFDEAEEAYKKALEVNPEYFDANYNLGAMFYNQAVEKVNACNDIPPREQKKYEACIEESNKIFEQATPYLEKALEVKPDDESTMQSLKNVYARTGADEKYLEMKKMLGEE
jgi:tetratricopeptide (TPR) repeat protein